MPSSLSRFDAPGIVHFITISCFHRLSFFDHETVRDAFVGAMQEVQARLDLVWIGYVVMPEHVHLLVLSESTRGDLVPISLLLEELKALSGRDGKAALRRVWREHRSLGNERLDYWALHSPVKRFWKPRGYVFPIFNLKTLREKLDYMHRNPVRRGLVERPDEWVWSSFHSYETGDDPVLAMGWDGKRLLFP